MGPTPRPASPRSPRSPRSSRPHLLLLSVVKSPEEGPAAQRWVPQGGSFAPRISPLAQRHLHVLLFSGGAMGVVRGIAGGADQAPPASP